MSDAGGGKPEGPGGAPSVFGAGVETALARWRKVLETTRDGIVSIDRSSRITAFNRAAEAIWGFTADEVLGQDVKCLMASPYREQHADYVAHYERTGEKRAIGAIREVEGCRHNGEIFPLELSVTETKVAGEVSYTAILRDVSKRKEAEAELRRLHRIAQERRRMADIGAITAKIVHDMANPLAAISMVSEGILRRIERVPEAPVTVVQGQAERLLTTTRRLDQLLAEFKDFTRGQRLRLRAVDLGALFRSLAEFWLPEARSHGLSLHVEPPPEGCPLRGDVDKLHRVFDNLLKNSIEAIDGPDGAIELRVRSADNERLVLEVRDSGPGFPSEVDAFALFETTKPHGTGLGLPICQQIVEAHGGTLRIDRNVEAGAAILVDLPSNGPPIP